ncbi:MAG: glutaredoxin family protein [Ottowia sp.]|nr:glutaredoxin family protein [Ottowia sp.]
MKWPTLPTAALALAAGALLGTGAQAQVYRSVDAQGHVTFSDTPGPAAQAISAGGAAGAGSAVLPYALRQVQARYPVTLYAGPQCAPCDSGRQLLRERGIPFTEKSVASAADVEALHQLAGGTELPLLTVGSTQVKGFEAGTWGQYLDAAGYPATSQLPHNWQAAAPTPLATPATPAADAADAGSSARDDSAAAPAQPEPDALAPARTAENPAGIRF